jgi:hypothetical protein
VVCGRDWVVVRDSNWVAVGTESRSATGTSGGQERAAVRNENKN